MVRRQSQDALVAPCKQRLDIFACLCVAYDVVSYPSQLTSGFVELIEESFQEVNTAPKVGMSVLIEILWANRLPSPHNEIYLMG